LEQLQQRILTMYQEVFSFDKADASCDAKTIEASISASASALFLKFAKDAPEWHGNPFVGEIGNVGRMTKAECGHFTHLKRAGLLTTTRRFYPGCFDHAPNGRWETWIEFSEKGRALANAHGLGIGDGKDPA
jgi:hypothetical protein